MARKKKNNKKQTFDVYPHLGQYQYLMRTGGQLPWYQTEGPVETSERPPKPKKEDYGWDNANNRTKEGRGYNGFPNGQAWMQYQTALVEWQNWGKEETTEGDCSDAASKACADKGGSFQQTTEEGSGGKKTVCKCVMPEDDSEESDDGSPEGSKKPYTFTANGKTYEFDTYEELAAKWKEVSPNITVPPKKHFEGDESIAETTDDQEVDGSPAGEDEKLGSLCTPEQEAACAAKGMAIHTGTCECIPKGEENNEENNQVDDSDDDSEPVQLSELEQAMQDYKDGKISRRELDELTQRYNIDGKRSSGYKYGDTQFETKPGSVWNLLSNVGKSANKLFKNFGKTPINPKTGRPYEREDFMKTSVNWDKLSNENKAQILYDPTKLREFIGGNDDLNVSDVFGSKTTVEAQRFNEFQKARQKKDIEQGLDPLYSAQTMSKYDGTISYDDITYDEEVKTKNPEYIEAIQNIPFDEDLEGHPDLEGIPEFITTTQTKTRKHTDDDLTPGDLAEMNLKDNQLRGLVFDKDGNVTHYEGFGGDGSGPGSFGVWEYDPNKEYGDYKETIEINNQKIRDNRRKGLNDDGTVKVDPVVTDETDDGSGPKEVSRVTNEDFSVTVTYDDGSQKTFNEGKQERLNRLRKEKLEKENAEGKMGLEMFVYGGQPSKEKLSFTDIYARGGDILKWYQEGGDEEKENEEIVDDLKETNDNEENETEVDVDNTVEEETVEEEDINFTEEEIDDMDNTKLEDTDIVESTYGKGTQNLKNRWGAFTKTGTSGKIINTYANAGQLGADIADFGNALFDGWNKSAREKKALMEGNTADDMFTVQTTSQGIHDPNTGDAWTNKKVDEIYAGNTMKAPLIIQQGGNPEQMAQPVVDDLNYAALSQFSNNNAWDSEVSYSPEVIAYQKKIMGKMGKGGQLPKAQFGYISSGDGRSNLNQSLKLAGTTALASMGIRAANTGLTNRANYKDAYEDYLSNQGPDWYDEMCTEQGCPSWEENRLELLGGHSEPDFAWFKDQDNLFGKNSVMNKHNVLQDGDLANAYWQNVKQGIKDGLYTGAINYGLNYLTDRTRPGRKIKNWWQDRNLPTINVGYLSRRDGGPLPTYQGDDKSEVHDFLKYTPNYPRTSSVPYTGDFTAIELQNAITRDSTALENALQNSFWLRNFIGQDQNDQSNLGPAGKLQLNREWLHKLLNADTEKKAEELNFYRNGGSLPKYQGDEQSETSGWDLSGYFSGEQGWIPDYGGKSTTQTVNENKDKVQNVADAVSMTGIPGVSQLAGYTSAAVDGYDAYQAYKSGDMDLMKQELAKAGTTAALSTVPGGNVIKGGVKAVTKATGNQIAKNIGESAITKNVVKSTIKKGTHKGIDAVADSSKTQTTPVTTTPPVTTTKETTTDTKPNTPPASFAKSSENTGNIKENITEKKTWNFGSGNDKTASNDGGNEKKGFDFSNKMDFSGGKNKSTDGGGGGGGFKLFADKDGDGGGDDKAKKGGEQIVDVDYETLQELIKAGADIEII